MEIRNGHRWKTGQLWTPDTCGCAIEFEYDMELSQEERVPHGTRVFNRNIQPAIHVAREQLQAAERTEYEALKAQDQTKARAAAQAVELAKAALATLEAQKDNWEVCEAHRGSQSDNAKDAAAHHDYVLEENQRKNQALSAYLQAKGIAREKYPKGRRGDQDFGFDMGDALDNITYHFDPMDSTGFRRLHLTVNDPTCNKHRLRSVIDSTQTKVVVE